MSLNKATTTDIRPNFNLGGDEIKCNELFVKNLKYNIFTKTKFIPIVYINDENTSPTVYTNQSYFYTTGSTITFFGNLYFLYSGSTISTPEIYLTLPTDFEPKVGSDLMSNIGTLVGISPGQSAKNFSVLYRSNISLTPINVLPALKLTFVDDQGGSDFSSAVHSLTFECVFQL